MPNRVPGVLWFHFAVAVMLTAPVSAVVLAWYRRTVSRSMRAAGAAPVAADPWLDQDFALNGRAARSMPPGSTTGAHGGPAADATSALASPRTRLAVVYGAAGLAAAAVMAGFKLRALGEPIALVRTFAVFYVCAWPVVPTISFLLVWPRRRAMLAFALYVLAGAAAVVALSAAVRYGQGRLESVPLRNAATFLQLLGWSAWLPFLVIAATSGRRIRSVAPVVLAGLLVFSFSNVAIVDAQVMAMDVAPLRAAVLKVGGKLAYEGWYMLAALPVGYACWLGLRWLGRLSERKAFSDAQLVVDAWWLIVVLVFATFLANDYGWGALTGLSAFLAYRCVVAAGLASWRLDGDRLGNRRLLLLRVFGFQRRTETLFDRVAQGWRFTGSVKLIAGSDLARRAVDPGDLIAFLGGRLRQLFVGRDRPSRQRLERLDERRDPDGRFRVSKVYCHADTWRPTLRRLLAVSDVVLMDLRGFKKSNDGCLFELRQLVENGLVPRTVFVVDGTTDTALLEAVLSEQAREAGAPDDRAGPAPRLVAAEGASRVDPDKVHDALLALGRA